MTLGFIFEYIPMIRLVRTYVRNENIIHQGCSISEREILQGSGNLETRGYVLIWGVYDRHTNATIDVKLGNADIDTYIFEPMKTLLARWKKTKKDKNGNKFHEQRIFFLCSFC